MRRPLAAVTGATGFIGRHVAAALTARGWRLRLLVRQKPASQVVTHDAEIVVGDLASDAALRKLVRGVDAVVHAAGLIRARDDRDYFSTNVTGTGQLGAAICGHAPTARFVVISSLAAREPQLSAYAASKRAGEEAALAACGTAPVAVLRPAAVYGPWDRETLRVFQAACRRFMAIPANGAKISLLHVADFADAVAAVAENRDLQGVFEITDSNWTGYLWTEIVAAVATALGSNPRIVPVPAALLRAAAPLLHVARFTRAATMFNPGKLREILHDDWSSRPAAQLPTAIWAPKIGLDFGFAQTAQWYVENGWMRPAAPR